MAPLIERLEARQFLASIAGNVFNDANANRIKDGGEANLSGRTLYVDQNDNKKLDAPEPRAVTDASGNYKISNLAAGLHLVRQVLPAGWTQTSPSGGLANHVIVTATQTATGKNFGSKQTITTTARTISGKVFVDFDKDGILDVGESSKAGIKVHIDLDKDFIVDPGEPVVFTNAAGNYSFSGLAPGSYVVRAIPLNTPKNAGATKLISVVDGNATGINFSYRPLGVAGQLWVDADKDGIKDSGESALTNWRVYWDANRNGKWEADERTALTDVNGYYNIIARDVGIIVSARVRVVQQPGYTLIAPTSGYIDVPGTKVTPPYPQPAYNTYNKSDAHFRFTKP